ncbi:MAG: carbohydrate ABC transporter permease [Chloroflexi bacterium]|nr:carbohydrate ABC transporter permease [Chloroflexota bacterium]MXX82699.1 carbohydrate ABC transporter permease [Chloroflexota bacterium]MYA93326.1 carbohydrate ABC transporter permease [Chloroflexota bacterium]MYC56067.1 carbohydrate ABC transporter permease [Chloroflexota bacterium]MYD38806.1 carbohydrate ABC transporter permease [Chloroflexota bacterium]
MVAPFVWLVSSSLKTQLDIFNYPPDFLPDPWVPQNYINALTYKPFGLYFRNTVLVAGLNVIAVVFTSSFCAYGFARLRFPGRDFWFGIVMATLFLPYAILLVPSFIVFSRLGWVDTFLPLVVPQFFGGGAFNIFLMRQFFRTIPEEIADAARIDGCSEFGVYWRIMLPLSKPALITIGIFTFLFAWNDLIGPMTYLRSPDNFTIAVGLASFRSQTDIHWDLQLAASAAVTLPVIAIFFVSQRYFIQGVVMTGLKG